MEIKCLHFEQIDSTNTWAKKNIHLWSTQGMTLITAGEQTAGRGRFKRRWESPPHVNIYASFCYWFDVHRADLGHVPVLLALAGAMTLEKLGFCPTIKWPNDLLLNGKKIGGILCETLLESHKRGFICGIGLNINMSPEELSAIDRPATSLFAETGQIFDVEVILSHIKENFFTFFQEFIFQGFHPFYSLVLSRSTFRKGDRVRFFDNQVVRDASFERWNLDGSVELLLDNDQLKVFHAGEFIS